MYNECIAVSFRRIMWTVVSLIASVHAWESSPILQSNWVCLQQLLLWCAVLSHSICMRQGWGCDKPLTRHTAGGSDLNGVSSLLTVCFFLIFFCRPDSFDHSKTVTYNWFYVCYITTVFTVICALSLTNASKASEHLIACSSTILGDRHFACQHAVQ